MNRLDELTAYGIINQVPILQGEGIEILESLLKEKEVRSFLEIGTAIGRTSLLVASLHPEMKVVTVERNPEMIAQARKNFQNSTLGNQIELIEGDALEVDVPKGPYDCIFIDAAKSQYIRFFEKYAPLLSENGVIVSDNMDFHGLVAHPERTNNRNTKGLVRKLQAYREFLLNHPDYDTVILSDGDGIALTRRKK